MHKARGETLALAQYAPAQETLGCASLPPSRLPTPAVANSAMADSRTKPAQSVVTDIADIRALIAGGQTPTQIAPLFEVQAPTIRRWLKLGRIPSSGLGRKRGGRNEHPSTERSRAIVEALKAGHKLAHLARVHGVGVQSVYDLKRRWVDRFIFDLDLD